MADLQALLSKRADEIVRPPSLPGGEYILTVTKRESAVSSQKKTDGIKFTFTVFAPHESVDREALDKVPNWRGKEISDTFWLTEASIWRLAGAKNPDGSIQPGFFQFLGIDTTGKMVMECLPETIGKQVMATVIQEASQDGLSTYNKITKYQAV